MYTLHSTAIQRQPELLQAAPEDRDPSLAVLTAAISSRGSSQLLRESEHETLSTTFSC